MKILVCGSRDYDDHVYFTAFLNGALDKLIKSKGITKDDVVILSGMANGADMLAFNYANQNGIKVEEHPAEWDLHGKMAGFLRNAEMVREADITIAFFKDKETNGTKHTVSLSKKKKIPTVAVLNRKIILNYKPEISEDDDEMEIKDKAKDLFV